MTLTLKVIEGILKGHISPMSHHFLHWLSITLKLIKVGTSKFVPLTFPLPHNIEGLDIFGQNNSLSTKSNWRWYMQWTSHVLSNNHKTSLKSILCVNLPDQLLRRRNLWPNSCPPLVQLKHLLPYFSKQNSKMTDWV